MRALVVLLISIFILVGCSTTDNIAPKADLKQAAYYNYQLGLAYLQQQNAELSYQKLQLASQQDPSNASVWLALAYFYQKMGRGALVESMYQKALKLAPNRGEILNNYAAFCCQQGQFAKAQRYFAKALADSSYLYPEKIKANQVICMKMAESG